MAEAPSPADYLERVEVIAPLIRDNVAWSQRERRLAPAVVDAFHDHGLFRMLITRELGGGGLPEIEAARVIEAIARVDASAAWNVMIAGSSAGYARALEPAIAAGILGGPRMLIAGVINPHTIRLRAVEGGYVVSGRGPFASGCSQATWFGAGGLLVGDSQPGGPPSSSLLLAFFPASQGKILDTWKVSGLRGTGSHDILFNDVFVPAERVANNRDVPSTRAGVATAAVAVGAACHALEQFVELAAGKVSFGSRSMVRDRADVQIAVARATGMIEAAHALMTSYLAELPDRARGGEPWTLKQQGLLRMSCVMAADLAVQAVDLIHTVAGTSSLPEDSVIGLCWRDIHAVQHNLSVQPRHYEAIGKILLGAEGAASV
jgi:alkylation response protein AidB-like acyl-CoA dehydrogenase